MEARLLPCSDPSLFNLLPNEPCRNRLVFYCLEIQRQGVRIVKREEKLTVHVYRNGTFETETILCDAALAAAFVAFPSTELYMLPGFADVHVHLREPGFSYKETVKTGTRAAAHGGYTAVCAMPNLAPVPHSLDTLSVQMEAIARDACVLVKPFGAITVGEEGKALSDMEAMAPYVCGYSDDGRGVADGGMMREAMQRAKALDRVIAAHCEDVRYAPEDAKSEWSEVERDILLAKDTHAKLHICHVSSRVSVDLIREAKKDGIDVTAETAPHYLLLDRSMRRDAGNWKMNPPLRDKEDRDALLCAIADGTLDTVATDHAPHSAEEKSRGYEKSLNGIVGLECAFPTLYTDLVKNGILTPEALIHRMSVAPRKRFGIGGETVTAAEHTLWALGGVKEMIDPNAFLSLGRSTPFDGVTVDAHCIYTKFGGENVWTSPVITTEN